MVEIEVDGRRLSLSNLEKLMYPEAGWTKAHVIDYYRRIGPVLLPHLADRPVTLKRYPDGVAGEFFYERSCPSHRPAWLRTAPVWSRSRGAPIEYCVLDDLPSLVWAANLADLELHVFLHRASDADRPTSVVFDLDPGPPAGLVACARVALLLRDLLEELGLRAVVKTSGSKGLQLHLPLNTPTSYAETKPFARAAATALQRHHGGLVTANMRRSLRRGKVLVDWSQNDDHKTTVGPYSLRAKPRPSVSTPLDWREIEQAVEREDANGLVFSPQDVLARTQARGDLFAPVLDLEQALPALG